MGQVLMEDRIRMGFALKPGGLSYAVGELDSVCFTAASSIGTGLRSTCSSEEYGIVMQACS